MDKEMLVAFGELLNETLDAKLAPLKEEVATLRADMGNFRSETNVRFNKIETDMENFQSETNEKLEEIQENLNETRGSVNTLLEWAEDAQVQVHIPLFRKAE